MVGNIKLNHVYRVTSGGTYMMHIYKKDESEFPMRSVIIESDTDHQRVGLTNGWYSNYEYENVEELGHEDEYPEYML